MDNPEKAQDARIKELELKVQAILEALKLVTEYTAEKYTLVKPAEGEKE
jgi:hypothetical protein